MAKWAICVAKYRYDDAQGSATRFVISYFSNVKQLMTKRENIMTSLSMLTLLLAPKGFWLCNQYVAWAKQCFLECHIWYPGAYCARTAIHLLYTYYYSHIIQKCSRPDCRHSDSIVINFSLHVWFVGLFFSSVCPSSCSISPSSPTLTIQVPPYEVFPVKRAFFSQCCLF